MISRENKIITKVIGYSGKRYVSSLDEKEFSEVYNIAKKCLFKKIKPPRKLIEIEQSIICSPTKNHFELEVILTGNYLS